MVVVVAIKQSSTYQIHQKPQHCWGFFCVEQGLLICMSSIIGLSSGDGVHAAAYRPSLFVVVAPSLQEGDVSTAVVDGGFKQLLQAFLHEDRLQKS